MAADSVVSEAPGEDTAVGIEVEEARGGASVQTDVDEAPDDDGSGDPAVRGAACNGTEASHEELERTTEAEATTLMAAESTAASGAAAVKEESSDAGAEDPPPGAG